MRGDDWSPGGGDGVKECFIGDVRYVHHHTHAVHFEDNLFAEISEAVVMLDLGIVDVSGRVCPLIRV